MTTVKKDSDMRKEYAPDIIAELQQKYSGLDVKVHTPRRVYLAIDRALAHDLAQYLFEIKKCRFSIATGIDTRRGIEIIYNFSHDASGTYYNVKTVVPKDDLKIKSLTDFLPAANWIEREIHELLGVDFIGHPNLAPLLTPDDWPETAYPLRRDYESKQR
jgi:NADH-quinone oxidoreductase subunit C